MQSKTGRMSCVCDWLRDQTGLDFGDRSWICNAAIESYVLSSIAAVLIEARWLLSPGSGAEYYDQPVCLSACEHISGTTGPIGTKFCENILCGRGSGLLRRHCATLCSFGFMDDVTFGRSAPYKLAGTQHHYV